jgi:signal transduction histidine kinase
VTRARATGGPELGPPSLGRSAGVGLWRSGTCPLDGPGERGGAVRVAAGDFGVGIDETDLDRIFQAFDTTKSAGLGIALAVARAIVEAHGGRLEAEHNPDGGAIFSFTVEGAR